VSLLELSQLVAHRVSEQSERLIQSARARCRQLAHLLNHNEISLKLDSRQLTSQLSHRDVVDGHLRNNIQFSSACINGNLTMCP
jgi:hypothetical protein